MLIIRTKPSDPNLCKYMNHDDLGYWLGEKLVLLVSTLILLPWFQAADSASRNVCGNISKVFL